MESLISQLRTHKITYEQYRILMGLQKTAYIANHAAEMDQAYEIYMGQNMNTDLTPRTFDDRNV